MLLNCFSATLPHSKMSGNTDQLPESFDAVILGTGLCESVVAAALSRIGHSVLHLDRNSYYGELEATHSLKNILDYSNLHSDRLSSSNPTECTEDETSLTIKCDSLPSVSNLSYETYSTSEEELEVYERILQYEENFIKQQEKKSAKPVGAGEPSPESTEQKQFSESDNQPEQTKSSNYGDADQSETLRSTNEETGDSVKTGDGAVTEQQDLESSDNAGGSSTAVSVTAEELSQVTPVIKHYVKSLLENKSSQKEDEDRNRKLALLIKHSNRFILDLAPKLLYARSEMIDLLITSDVARYCEFRTITQILSQNKEKTLQPVPCSRSDIFSTKTLSMIEKRILMKVLTLCMEYENKSEELHDNHEGQFIDFLKSQRLTPQLIHYVQHAIAMVPESASTQMGIERTQMFLKSLGRYGPTPFLWPLYGGEINQAFCRMSAVFGGTYILHKTISQIIMNKEQSKVESIVCNEGMRIKCKWLICNPDYLLEYISQTKKRGSISRAIVITNGSLSTSDKEEAVLLSIPSQDGDGDPVSVMELGPAACVCPRDPPNLRVVHLTTKTRLTAEEDLKPHVRHLFNTQKTEEKKPRLLLACYFNIPDYSDVETLSTVHPDNMFITVGPDAKINPDNSIIKAKTIFTSICPDEEFLPRPPNPEDIIYCDDESKKQAEGETFTAEQSEAQQGQHEQSEKEAEPGNNESEAGGHEPEADKSDCKSSEHLEAKTSAVEEPES